jgi:hypothetical protein
MDHDSLNGHSPNGGYPQQSREVASINPYVDAVSGDRPREIVEFELHTDPYANMLPRVSSIAVSASADGPDSERKRHPVVVAVSILLIIVLVLPVMAEVFARLFH